jgi:hypothetical protein
MKAQPSPTHFVRDPGISGITIFDRIQPLLYVFLPQDSVYHFRTFLAEFPSLQWTRGRETNVTISCETSSNHSIFTFCSRKTISSNVKFGLRRMSDGFLLGSMSKRFNRAHCVLLYLALESIIQRVPM